MKIAVLHGPRDLRMEDHPLDSDKLGPHDLWVETIISALKIGTDRGNYEGAEQVPGAPDFPRWVGDSNLGVIRDVGASVTEFAVGDRVISRYPHQSEFIAQGRRSDREGPRRRGKRGRGIRPPVHAERHVLL